MAESSNLTLKARTVLATPSHEGLANVADQLFMYEHQTDEYQMAHALYEFCVAHFTNCLALKFLKLYRYSSDDVARFRSICLLSEILTGLRKRSFELSLVALSDIQPLLITCLTMPEATKSDTKILRKIVSFVSFNVSKLDTRGWDELGDCVLALANTDPLRAFNVFLDLPLVHEGFINRFLDKLVEEIYAVLLFPEQDIQEDWTLALETAVKLGIQLSDSGTLKSQILGPVLKSAHELVAKGKELFVQRGLAHLVKFLAQDSNLCSYSTKQCGFVSEFACMIEVIGTCAEEAARKIYQMVTELENYVPDPAFKLHSLFENQDLQLYNNLKILSAVDLMGMVAATAMDDKSREIAVRRVHDLLCDHTSRKVEIKLSEMRKLKKYIISCLTESGVPENTFKILGQVVFHVAHEMLSYREDKWFELWDYIASECKTEFEKTVYIFQCLTMMLDDKEHVIPAIDNLLPEIRRRLRHVLVDKSSWVLAFVGGFCAAIHLLESTSQAETVKGIVEEMVDSVRELVEGEMEVGLVRTAFRDLESIVKKQLDWYDAIDYRFVKALLWKLYAIKGLRMESKMVLWRINVILERGTPNVDKKELPKSQTAT